MSTDFMKLPPDLQARITHALQPGEVVFWAGQPDPGSYMRRGLLLWLFFIPWTAFSLFWMAGAAGFSLPDAGISLFFALLGLPFLLIGLGGLSAPLWLRRVARDTLYVVTSQRALVLEGRRQTMVRSWPPEALTAVTCSARADGSGDLLFATEAWDDGRGNRGHRQRGFFAVRDVRMAQACLQRLAATRR
jgi:hypothetical protein